MLVGLSRVWGLVGFRVLCSVGVGFVTSESGGFALMTDTLPSTTAPERLEFKSALHPKPETLNSEP